MRSFRRLFCILLCVAALLGFAGCDSDAVLQVGEQTVAIDFEGGNARAPSLTAFDMFLDNDGDNIPDDGQFYLWCKTILDPAQPDGRAKTTPIALPVSFGVEVKVLRAGETVATLVTNAGTSSGDANLTGYDSLSTDLGAAAPPVTVPNGPGGANNTYKFCQTTGPFAAFPPGCRLPRRTTAFVREIVMATSNPVSDFDPVTFEWGNGLCSTGDPGPEMTDGNAGGLQITVEKGDTLIVQLQRGPLPSEFVDSSGASLFADQPLVSAIVTLDGNSVTPNGSTSTEAFEGATVSFSLTTQ